MDLSPALQIMSRSDAGMVRSHNEDSIFISPVSGIAILADGMGGYNAGEVAAGMATTLLGSELERVLQNVPAEEVNSPNGDFFIHRALSAEIARTNAAIYDAARTQPQYAGMGTTLLAAVFYDNCVTVAHIGDSRLYRLRGDDFRVVTRDHSLLQEQIDSGIITAEEARRSHNRNLVTRALGVEEIVEPEIRDYDALPGDTYLLCSDGLNDMVDDGDIGRTLCDFSGNLELAANELVQMANDAGGRDNVSVVLVRILREYPAPRSWLGRMLARLK